MLTKCKGQSTLEYAVIIAVVIAGLLAMQHYVKRGYQGKLKGASDEMGQQFDPATYTGDFQIHQGAKVKQTVLGGTTTTTQVAPQVSNRTGSETQDAWSGNVMD